MEKITFGRELEDNIIFGLTLEEFKDLMLYHLEDYLFKTKFNEKVTNVSIPILGLSFTTEQRYALDLRGYFDIPQISFDENGCLYDNGKEKAYVSPEFFAKCFIERVANVWNAIYMLYQPKISMTEKKDAYEENSAPFNSSKNKNDFSHIDFIDIYNKLIVLKKLNSNLTEGMIGLIPSFKDTNRILSLRKIEYAAQVQKDIEFVLDQINKELYEERIYCFNNEEFYESEEFKILNQEHDRLFRMGPFIDALEPAEWESRKRIYDEGTEEERTNWRQKYDDLKKKYELQGLKNIKDSISKQLFPLSQIQKRVIDYLKVKIYNYDYQRNQGDTNNPFINELGLDQTAYYAHPSDKYLPTKINREIEPYDIECVTAEDYDMLYLNTKDEDFDNYSPRIN